MSHSRRWPHRCAWLPALGLLLGCQSVSKGPTERVRLNKTGAATFELIPHAQQLPYCLVYSVADTGVIRQLTMNSQNASFECPAQIPVGGRPFKCVVKEGPVTIYVVQTSEVVRAAVVTQQLVEAPRRQAITAMDLRLPGQVTLERLRFAPEEELSGTEGHVVSAKPDVDAGIP
jgi:hypothetical protein